MVDFTTDFLGTGFDVVLTGSITANPPTDVGLSRVFSDRSVISAASFSDNQPTQEIVQNYTGVYLWSYFDDFYNHIYIIPTSVDFGTISTDSAQNVTVWNAHLTGQRLTSITPALDTSITVEGIQTPINFNALEMKTLRVLASSQGGASVNTYLMFNFDGYQPLRLNVAGIRARFWEWLPNWSEPVSTVLSFKSDIFRSRSGKEQRSALRDYPRRTISFTAVVVDEKTRDFQRYMTKWFSRPALIPNFAQSIMLSERVDSGDSFIDLDAVPAWFTPQTNIIFMFGDRSEIKSILSVTDNRVVFSASIAQSWPIGTTLYYGVSGRLANNTKLNMRTNFTGIMDVKFEGEVAGEYWPEIPEPERVLGGYELFMLRPNYGASLQMDISTIRDVVDFDFGATYTYIPEAFVAPMYQNEYHFYTQDELWNLINFFRRMQGQVGEFYAPTWTDDIRMMEPTVLNTPNLRVSGQEFATDYANSTLHKYILINLRDGRQIIREVRDIYPVSDSIGDDSNIQLTLAWDEEIEPAMVNSICWVMRCRLGSDSITVSQRTSQVAIIVLSIKTLEVLD